jgi:lysyl-tRNA synthetase class 2
VPYRSDVATSARTGPVHVPSDLPRAPPFLLGGRVVARDETGCTVADALGTVVVETPAPPPLGALVLFSIRSGPAVDGAAASLTGEILEVREDRRAGGSGEAARLVDRRRGRALAARARLIASIRRFFVERGYLEVETPIAVPSPGLDVHLDAFGLDDAGGRGRFLITSPEYQMKRLLVGGLPRIFQITKCFRKGEVGARHNPEFTMLEWYRAWSGIDAMIEETEALVRAVAIEACGRPELVVAGRTIPIDAPFERLPLARAFARHAGLAEDDALALALSGRPEDEERWFRLLVEEVEPALAEGPPVVLVDWPASQASLARKRLDDPRVAERFEIVVGGVELCNGFGELVDAAEQRARFAEDQRARAARGLPVYPIDERFVASLDEGLPESAGNALGLDRLVALSLGEGRIGDVLAFPEDWL